MKKVFAADDRAGFQDLSVCFSSSAASALCQMYLYEVQTWGCPDGTELPEEGGLHFSEPLLWTLALPPAVIKKRGFSALSKPLIPNICISLQREYLQQDRMVDLKIFVRLLKTSRWFYIATFCFSSTPSKN